jgi:eukaryotic-like serine/threonine-protein kinase
VNVAINGDRLWKLAARAGTVACSRSVPVLVSQHLIQPTLHLRVPVSSPVSCIRCSQPLAIKSNSELCSICLSRADTTCLRFPTATAVPSEHPIKLLDPVAPDHPQESAPPSTVALPSFRSHAAQSVGIDSLGGLPLAPPGYELLRRLGGGAMGDVYMARELTSERTIAIKFLRSPSNPTAIERFLAEVRALARIDHPNIVKIYGTDFSSHIPFFTMEFVAGGTLADWVATNGTLSPIEAAKLTNAIARAIEAAHAANVLHRDVKPSNIILGENGSFKVVDFGLAKRTDRDEQLTLGNNPLGTPSFMPPEQISPQSAEIGPAADVYGLGATLYFLLTGLPPFIGNTPAEIVAQVETTPPERPRAIRHDIPADLETIVLNCLEKDPTDRYPTAAALANDLERFQAGLIPQAIQPSRLRRVRRWASRHRKQLLSAVGVLTLTIGAFFLGSAVWPQTKAQISSEPPDPLEEMQRELDSGQTVAVVNDAGWPRWHRLRIGEGSLVPSETKDKLVTLQTHGVAFVELIPDPRHDHYQISADVRHANGSREESAAGIYVGDNEIASASGALIHAVVITGFGEIYSNAELLSPAAKSLHGVKMWIATPFRMPNQTANMGRMSQKGFFPFTPCEIDPKPWRKLLFDVSLNGIECFWVQEDNAKMLIGRVPSSALAQDRQRVQRDLITTIHDSSPTVPNWHPRRPIGIWAFESVASFRNVKIVPIPDSR